MPIDARVCDVQMMIQQKEIVKRKPVEAEVVAVTEREIRPAVKIDVSQVRTRGHAHWRAAWYIICAWACVPLAQSGGAWI